MNKKSFFVYVSCVLLLLGAGIYLLKSDSARITIPQFSFPVTTSQPSPSVSSQSAELAQVKRVIDGDTIELVDGRKVRYIGIDTPELHHPTKGVQCFGKEAMEKNKELVEGKMIKMKKDISETDRYKRLLRYIWVGDIFVNEFLVQEGFASQATFPPDVAHVDLFKLAAEEARVNKKGLWSLCK